MTARIIRGVLVGLLLVATVVVVVLVWGFSGSGSTEVSEDAELDIIGSASLVSSVETSNATGSANYEIHYLVLGLPGQNAQDALRIERGRLEDAGWDVFSTEDESDQEGLEFGALSMHYDTIAFFQPLMSYLQEGEVDAMPEAEFADLRRRYAERDDLFIAQVQPRDP